MKKTVSIITFLIIFAMTFCGCGEKEFEDLGSIFSREQMKREGRTCEISLPNGHDNIWFPMIIYSENEISGLVQSGAMDAAEETGTEIVLCRAQTKEETEEFLRKALAAAPQGIYLSVDETGWLSSYINKAGAAGIPVYSMNGSAGKTKGIISGTENATKKGKLVGEQVIKGLEEVNKVGIVKSSTLDIEMSGIVDGFFRAVNVYGNVGTAVLNVVLSEDFSVQFLNFIDENSDLDAIFVVGENFLVQFADAMDHSKTDKDIAIIGTGNSEETLELIKDGEIFGTVATDWYGFGYNMVLNSLSGYAGVEYDFSTELSYIWIDSENADDYLAG